MVSNKIVEIIRGNLKTYTMILALAFIWLFFGYMTDWIFFSARNMSNLFRQMTIVSFLAIGMVLVIVTGNIDLSVGSACGLVSAVVAYLHVMLFPDMLTAMMPGADELTISIVNTGLSVLVGLAVGIIIGVCQGAVVAYLGVPAFIVTLGGMLVFRGGVLGVTQGKTIVPLEDSFVEIAQGYLSNELGLILGVCAIGVLFILFFRNRKLRKDYGFGSVPLYQDMLKAVFFSCLIMIFVFVMNSYRGIPIPVLIMGIMALIFSYITTNTKLGRYSYALGGNKEATRLSGINIKGNIFTIFVLMGILCGVSGIVLTAYVAAGTTSAGVNYELEAIAACVIGGTSLMGGEGTIFGAIVGSLIMASLLNGMSVMNMPIFWQFVIRGLVLVLAVYIDVLSKKKKI
jgi:D-xylose transport system permease protein